MIHNGYGEEDHTMSPESCRRDLKPRVIPNYGNIGEGRSEKDSQARAHKSLQLMQPHCRSGHLRFQTNQRPPNEEPAGSEREGLCGLVWSLSLLREAAMPRARQIRMSRHTPASSAQQGDDCLILT
jgi:hypothetical protein